MQEAEGEPPAFPGKTVMLHFSVGFAALMNAIVRLSGEV